MKSSKIVFLKGHKTFYINLLYSRLLISAAEKAKTKSNQSTCQKKNKPHKKNHTHTAKKKTKKGGDRYHQKVLGT